MKVKIYLDDCSDLCSRKSAAKVRSVIHRAICHKYPVLIDMGKVKSMSGSYADELFGMLVVFFGSERVLNSITIDGAGESVLHSIAIALDRRGRNENT